MKHWVINLLLPVCLSAYGQLPLPEVPDTLRTPRERADYIATHFYDAIDWNDPSMTSAGAMMQDWANYLSVMPHATPSAAAAAMKRFMSTVPSSLADNFNSMSEGYLFAIDSEMYDETLYLAALDGLASNSNLSPDVAAAYRSRHDYLARYAPGCTVTDFVVSSLDGKSQFDITDAARRADEVMLLFYDPDCEDCHEAMNTLATDPDWLARQHSGKLFVVIAEITPEVDDRFPILAVPAIYMLDGATLTIKSRNLPLQQCVK